MDNIEKYISKLEQEIKNTEDSIEKEEKLERVHNMARIYKGDDRVVSSHEILRAMKVAPPEKKIMTGISGLDSLLDGFRLKQVVVVAARAKSGKTSYAVHLASKLSENNPTMVLYEEPPEEIIQKFMDRNEDPPLFYTPRKNQMYDIGWLEERIIESKAKYNTEVVFIDHLDFLVPLTTNRHDLQMADTMRQIKGLAKKWNVVIVLLAHLRKTDPTSPPTTDDLRGTASIEQEADTIIMLWRNAERINGFVELTDQVNVSVQANRRNGRTGNVKMVFNNGKFLEEEWRTTDEQFETL